LAYQESWQPARISDKDLYEAQDMAEKVNETLGGGTFESNFSWLMMVFISRNYRLDLMIPEW
jgi:formate-dependent phosphoribosylglycinamide formyltransferase (GAR transformylase)